MYDITADSPTNDELAYLERVSPELATGHYDYCPTCNKLGMYLWRGVEHPCDCAMQLALAQHYTLSNIGRNYWRMGWDDYLAPLPPEIVEYRQFDDAYIQEGMGLILTGSKGVGKTMLTTLILKDEVKKGYSCYYTTFHTLSDHLTSSWGPGENARLAATYFVDRFEYSHMLLLDDLGKEFKASNSITANTFDRVMRTRVQNSRPVLTTTNYTVDEVISGYGEATFSLLVEQSIPVAMTGEDYRFSKSGNVRARVTRSQGRGPIQ